MDAYLTTSDARTLAATLPGLDGLVAKDDAALGALLLLATACIDSRKYQGQKYDPLQVHAFPRVDGLAVLPSLRPISPGGPLNTATTVWDWDQTANDGAGAAVVPDLVKFALLYQANWLGQSSYQKRIENIRTGLLSQGIGTASEAYNPAVVQQMTAGGMIPLCAQAEQFLNKYRLSSGRIV